MYSVKNICLGTVKLGDSNYGFSSKEVDKDFDAIGFLKKVQDLGVQYFDTSPRYGISEKVIGKYVSSTNKKPLVSSKIDNLKTSDSNSIKLMEKSVRLSLEDLGLEKLDTCYLHQNEIEVLSDKYIQDGLKRLKELDLIESIGASVYSFEECEYAISSGIFDVIQVPINIFDISFYNKFVKNYSGKIKFIARSLLLQGVLVNRNQMLERISRRNGLIEYLDFLDMVAERNQMSVLELGLRFVFSLENIQQFVIGTRSINNLEVNLGFLNKDIPKEVLSELLDRASDVKVWSNPRNWN